MCIHLQVFNLDDCDYQLVSTITDGSANWNGEAIRYGYMGTDMTSIGDLNGDGVMDIAVIAGDDYFPQDGNSDRIWILFMNADGTINHQSEISRIRGGINEPLYQRPWKQFLNRIVEFILL